MNDLPKQPAEPGHKTPQALLTENSPLKFLPPYKTEPCCNRETIAARANAITPLLDNLLKYRPPKRWGINE